MKKKSYPKNKKCRVCLKTLPIDNFAWSGAFHNGVEYRRGTCRLCHALSISPDPEQYLKNKAYEKELHALQKKGKKRCRHCEEIKILDDFDNDCKGQVHYDKKSYCKKCAREKWRIPYAKTEGYKKIKRASDKRHYSKHKDKIHKQRVRKYHEDPQTKLKHTIRCRLGSILKAQNIEKVHSSVKLVGCDAVFLKQYIESQFQNGMSWNNWAKEGWHLDHIIPLSAYDLTDVSEQKKAFHYTNLRPIWHNENLSKQNTVDMELIKAHGIEELLPLSLK